MVPGIDVPEPIIERMEGVPSDRQSDEGISIALEIVEELRQMRGVAGVHLISIRGEESIVRVVEEAGLLPRPAAVEAAPAG
jgi:methylenetetrahydrofolate reductase (NADPH)